MTAPNLKREHHAQLFTLTNSMRTMVFGPEKVTPRRFAETFSDICKALTASMRSNLKDAVFYPYQLRGKTEFEEARQILRDASSFTEFIKVEKRHLLSLGFEEETVEGIIEDIAGSRTYLQHFEYDPERVWRDLTQIQSVTCKLAKDASLYVERKDLEHHQKMLTMKVNAVAVQAANVIAGTIPLALPFAVASVISGGGVFILCDEMANPADKII